MYRLGFAIARMRFLQGGGGAYSLEDVNSEFGRQSASCLWEDTKLKKYPSKALVFFEYHICAYFPIIVRPLMNFGTNELGTVLKFVWSRFLFIRDA